MITIEEAKLRKFKLVAIQDGFGDGATMSLLAEDKNGEHIDDVKWPLDWPPWVSKAYVEKRGFRYEVA